MSIILQIRQLEKTYRERMSRRETHALRGVSMDLTAGDFLAIMGESGSGKSTLLNLIATLDRPTGGQIFFDGKNLQELTASELATFRRERLGFVFQDFNLLDQFNVGDNIRLPMVLSKIDETEMQNRVNRFATLLGIERHLKKYPYELSGGEQQRVAIARALVMRPDLILADEPTGALDSKNSDNLMRAMAAINDNGQTILMVTHSIRAASFAKHILFLRDGQIYHELFRGTEEPGAFRERISDALTLLDVKEA